MMIRMKVRDVNGSKEVFAMVDCPQCGSTLSCGEWLSNMREARNLAVGGLAEHRAKYPGCKRPTFQQVR